VPEAERRILLTCEHGGHRVPAAWRGLFAGRQALLRSHRGWDPGALAVARSLARSLGAPLVAATTTRLLVDPNRSEANPAVFSAFTRGLDRESRRMLLARHHRPHWERVRAAIAAHPGGTLHLAVHSFTPALRGERRDFALGLLYDPKRRRERELAIAWQNELAAELGRGAVRRNAPYRGDSDGLTTALRREHSERRYLGVELELSQALLAHAAQRRALLRLLRRALRAVA
jgi:predicted N-formylglutamate amidohydrolase